MVFFSCPRRRRHQQWLDFCTIFSCIADMVNKTYSLIIIIFNPHQNNYLFLIPDPPTRIESKPNRQIINSSLIVELLHPRYSSGWMSHHRIQVYNPRLNWTGHQHHQNHFNILSNPMKICRFPFPTLNCLLHSIEQRLLATICFGRIQWRMELVVEARFTMIIIIIRWLFSDRDN